MTKLEHRAAYETLEEDLTSHGMSRDEAKAYITIRKNLSSKRWRMDNLYRIVDAHGHDVKFSMNYAQKILYLGLWYCNLILKSRQHGITTFVCLLYLDTCLFNSNTHACIIAHNKEDAQDFFDKKVLYAYDNLPKWLKKEFPSERKGSKHVAFRNGSSIRVTTSGRSGTYQRVHVSEFGKMCAKYPLKAQEVITGTLNAVHEGMIITIESTAEGREGKFFKMCNEAQNDLRSGKSLGKLDYKFFFFGWPENELNQTDPDGIVIPSRLDEYFSGVEFELRQKLTDRQKAWYVSKERIQGDLMFQEHPSTPEEAFLKSLEGAYYQKQMRKLRKNGHITTVPPIPHIPVDTWQDIGIGDENAVWFSQNVGREIHLIHYYENSGESMIHYLNYIRDWIKERELVVGRFWFPHDMRVREYSYGKSREKIAEENGVKPNIGTRTGEDTQIERVRAILPICFFDEAECEIGIDALDSFRKEWNEKLGCYREKPLHDWASHGSKAFALMAMENDLSTGFTQSFEKSGTASNLVSEHEKAKSDPRGWT